VLGKIATVVGKGRRPRIITVGALTDGVGPADSYVSKLDPEHRTALRDRCRALLSTEPFTVRVRAWAARGLV